MKFIKTAVRKILLGVLPRFGIDMKIAHACMLTPMTLHRITNRGIEINSVLDVGASNGRWSLEAKPFWPKAFFHLIEANPYHKDELEQVVKNNSTFSFILAAAGDSVGKTFFDTSDPFGGIAGIAPDNGQESHEIPMTTIDTQVKMRNLPGPYLVKLDTHGFEVPILNGALETLKNTALVILETYNFDIAEKSLRFYEMCSFMDKLGFRVIDISEPLWRIKDKAFWQIDLFFIKSERTEFDSNQYL